MALVYLSFSQHTFAMGSTVKNSVPILNINQGEWIKADVATIMKKIFGGIEAKDRNFPMPKGVADSLGLHPKSYMRVTDILTTKDDKQLLKVQFITIGKSGEEVVGQGWVIPGLAMGEDANHTIIAKDGRDGPQGTTVGPDLETVSGKIGVMLDAKKLSSVLAGATSLRDTLELGAPSLWDFSLSDAAIQVQSIVRISLDLFVPGTILNAVLGSLGNLSDHDRELNLTKESLVEGLGRVGEAMDAIKNDMGQLTTQALQLENHGKIMNQLFKTAGLDGEVTRSAVEAFTQISGLKNISARMMSLENDVLEWGFEMDSIQTMGDAKKAAQSLNAIKKELSSLKEMISTGTRVLDKRIQLTFEVEKSLVEMIKNPEKSIEGNRKLIDLFRIHQGGKVLPEPIYQRFKTGLILGMVNQDGRLAERTERELLAADMDTLLAMRDDIKSIGEGGIKGDLIDNPNGWQVLGQVGVGFTPAGMAADARDVAANAGKVWESGGTENKLMLAMSGIGFVPGFGDAAKMMVKSRLSRAAAKELDEASHVVGKLLAEAPSAFKNTDELVTALKAEGLMVDGFKASMKGGLVVLEMSADAGAALAKNPKQLQSLAQFAEAKGIGRISLKVSGPESKRVLASFESTGALGRETLVRLSVEAADEVKVAKGARDVAWKDFLSAKADTAKAKTAFNETADALASGKNNIRGLEQYKEQINDLTNSFNKGEVSADEFSRRVESIMGEAGFERQGDTFVSRGSIEIDPGNKTELRDSSGAMGRDGRPLQEVSGNSPSGPSPDRRIAETGEGVWQGNKEGRKRAQEYAAAGGREAAAGGREAAAGGREAAAGGALSSEIRRVRFKNERLEGKLGDLRTRQGEAVGREETARRRSVDAGTRVRERIQDVNYVGARLAAVSKIENSFALRVEVNVDWTKGDVQVKDVFDTLRNETASKGVSHNWLGGLDPFTAHPGVTKPAVGMVKATTAEIGENAGEIIIYSARDSLSAAENYRSVDRTRLASNARGNRFWAALYGAEDRVTAASEVMGKKGAPDPTHFNVYRLDLSKARVLDLTDPAVAKSFGYEKLGSVADKTKAYPVSQDVAQKARLLGYDVIKVPSVKTGKSNWDVLDNFETLVKEVKTRPGIEAATPDVVSQAKAIVFPPAPSTAESTKNLLMLGGGSLLMGGFGKNTHAKGEESKIASPEVRAAQTMGTLGIGTVVNSLRGVDLGAATSKTLDAGARVWDITKAIGTKIWDNAKSFTQDAGIIMSHTWNSSPSQDEIKPTFIPSAEVQAPLPTLNLMEFSPAKATPPTDSFDNHSDGQKGADYTNSLAVETLSGLLGPMPSTPSEVVTAGWDSLPVPFKPQAILVASAMGFNAYGEGRDYHVVGSNQQGHGVGVWKSIASIFATMTGAVRSIFVTSFSKVADWLTGRSAQGLTLKGGELYAREGTKPVKLQTARGGTIEVMAGEGGKIGKLEQGKIILGDGLTVNGVPVLSGTMTMKGGTGRIESLRLPMGKVGGMEVPGGVYRLDGQGKGWLELPGQSLGLSGGTLTLAAESVTSHDVGLEMAYIGGLGTWLSPEGENFSFVRALVIKGDAGGVLLERKGEFFVAADGKIESVTSIAGRIQENAKVAVADVGAVKALEGRIGAAFGKLGIDNATEKAGQGIKAARLEAERNLRTAEIWTNLGESEQWEMAALVSGGKMDLGRWETRVASLERGVERLAKAETLLKQVEGGLTERGLIRAELQEVKGKGEGMFRAGIRDMVKSEFSDTQDTLRAKAEWANNVVERGVDFALAEREARNDITAPTDKGRVTRLIKWPGFLMEKMLVKGVDLSEDLDTLAAQGDMDAKLTEAFNVFRIAKWGYDKTAELYDRPTGVRVASVWFGLVGRGALEVANWIVPVVRLGAVTAVVVEHHTEKAALRFGMEKEDAQKWGGWLGLGSGILLFAGTASATTKASAFLNPNVRGAVGESARSFTLGSGKEFAQALGITTGIVVAVEGGVELGGKALGWTRLQIDDGKEVGFMIAGNVVARVLQRQASRLKVQAEEKMKLALAEEMAVRGPRNELRLNLEKRIESVMSSGGRYSGREDGIQWAALYKT